MKFTMALLPLKRRSASRSQSGDIARRGRSQSPWALTPRRPGGLSSLLRLTPLQGEASPAQSWPSLALARLGKPAPCAPAFLCTDFAPSQWLAKS
jgi:hypothetical protein